MSRVLLILIFILYSHLNAYESEDQIKAVIVGKVAKFIKWEDKQSENFVITILNNPFEKLFENIYKDKKIHSKNVEIKYIDNIDDLSFTNILYIPKMNTEKLKQILKKIENKNILTISDMRNFAIKGGIIQVNFHSQLAKLKINLAGASKENLQIKASLLSISDVINGEDHEIN